MPLIAYYFHIITPITILANLVAIPICFVLLSMGIAALLFSVFLHVLSVIFYEAIWLLDNLMFYVLKYFCSLPGSFFEVKNFPFFYIFIYYAVLLYTLKVVLSPQRVNQNRHTLP